MRIFIDYAAIDDQSQNLNIVILRKFCRDPEQFLLTAGFRMRALLTMSRQELLLSVIIRYELPLFTTSFIMIDDWQLFVES